MVDSIRELRHLKLRSTAFSICLSIGIISIAFAVILGLGAADPLSTGGHFIALAIGCTLILFAAFFHANEETFASRYDMTHILDIDDKEERYLAYLEHLSDWIEPGMEDINPTLTRGGDPSGPDWGKTDFKLGHEPTRRDAIIEGEKYSGLEGELTPGEKLVEQANVDYAGVAQRRWEKAEANDPDLVEYGVERLGDLVRTEYFEKNAEDGVFTKLVQDNDESQ
ncbi:MAG: hypothetical protein HOE76_02330 [Euryarchaeota archaeon]|jgi:hypothetical protein|nr:hypothetical protein [Euryarchaeota archaeon]MBT5183642.1 hypothetical protein [Euryarchaeota archaeon]